MADPQSTPVARIQWLSSLMNPWALRAAVALGLPDLLAEGSRSTADLAQRSDTDPDALARLLRHLAVMEVVEESNPDRWELGELGEPLRRTHPAQLWRNLDQNDPYLATVDAGVSGLLTAIRRGASAWPDLHHRSFWAETTENPAFGSAFDRLMDHYSTALGPVLAGAHDWGRLGHLVDVGGGRGRVLATILAAHPTLRATLVDLPDTVAGAEPILARSGVDTRCDIVAQSFFSPLPSGHDAYLLVNVVHNWGDQDARRILRRCREAARHDARILLVERLVDRTACRDQQLVSSTKDLHMLLLLGGRERTEDHHRRLATEAGLVPLTSRALPGTSGLSLLEYSVTG